MFSDILDLFVFDKCCLTVLGTSLVISRAHLAPNLNTCRILDIASPLASFHHFRHCMHFWTYVVSPPPPPQAISIFIGSTFQSNDTSVSRHELRLILIMAI